MLTSSKALFARPQGARGRAEQKEGDMMPLTMAKPGETVTIRKVTGRDEVRQHLAELGFVADGTVTVVSELAGNLILQVKDRDVYKRQARGGSWDCPRSW